MKLSDAWRSRAVAIFLALLLAAFAAFGALLVTWIAASEASSLRHQSAALMNQADRLANDLDLELSFVEEGLLPAPGVFGPGEAAAFSERLRAVRAQERWPQLVEKVYLVDERMTAGGSRRFSAGGPAFAPLEPSDPLALALEDIAENGPRGSVESSERLVSLLSASGTWRILSLREDERGPAPGPEAGASGYLLLKLDETVLEGTVLPELGRRYFGPGSDFGDFRVRVANRSAGKALSLGAAGGSVSGWGAPDFSRALFPQRAHPHVATLYLAARGAPEPSGRGPQPPEAQGSLSPSFPIDAFRFTDSGRIDGWRLEAIHRSGSLDRALREKTALDAVFALGFLAALYALLAGLIVFSRRSVELAARERAFVASVSHELKTPVAVILSAADNLEKGIVGPDRVPEYGRVIAKEGRRLRDSVDSILSISGLQAAQSPRGTETFPLAEAAAAAIAVQEEAALAKGVGISLREEARPIVKASKALLESAAASLVSNAVKYGPEGGTVSVTVRASGKPGRRMAELAVEDSGGGISPAERRKLFSPFWRGRTALESASPGTGLGLYLARRIARLHGGDLRYRPRQGGGSTFIFSVREEIEA